ncbi:hypothetical protein BO78DRAFT_102599 [Aspergillus sclerotiicarbonarius CBS 121057]|uniref:Uncharacterized protein n=1 Tax=Aspergillus sclerotiicarbonarius (strain CBS 121057 / IBT 28362) TaxID=1448318 RepID=A0A319ENL0_ASPSB|nr:hypothetical protein BO78DRAFT_102599 [Aspergillus sclerotiicarbonarius CBS 121057]
MPACRRRGGLFSCFRTEYIRSTNPPRSTLWLLYMHMRVQVNHNQSTLCFCPLLGLGSAIGAFGRNCRIWAGCRFEAATGPSATFPSGKASHLLFSCREIAFPPLHLHLHLRNSNSNSNCNCNGIYSFNLLSRAKLAHDLPSL